MEREIILQHIKNAKENENVDFKREFYESLKDSDLVKDVAAFANLINDEDKYIIFGVDDGTREIIGVDPSRIAKQDDIDSYLENKLEPFLQVECGVIETADLKVVGYIKICSRDLNPPYVVKESCGKCNRIAKGDIYIRKGTCNIKASRADIDMMYMKNGALKIQIHDEVTVVEPIHFEDDIVKEGIYGHIGVEIFNDTTRPLLICDGDIRIETSKWGVKRSIWSTQAKRNIHDYPIEIPVQSRKIYTMLYDFYSQDCVDFGFDVDGRLDELVNIKVRLKDTDKNIYESEQRMILMVARGDVLHKVRLKESRKNKQKMS